MDRDIERAIPAERILVAEHWVVYTNVCKDLAKEKRIYSEAIKELFEPVIEDAKDKNNFEWEFIRRFYNNFKSKMANLCGLRIFCKFVFKICLLFDCDDDSLMMKMIFMYHEVLNMYKKLGFCHFCMHEELPKHYYSEDIKDTRPILMKVNELEGNTYKFTNRDFYSELAADVICEGDYTFMHFLVKYGLSYFPDDLMKEARIELQHLSDGYCHIKRVEGNEGVKKRNNFVRCTLKRLFKDVGNSNMRRIILIVKMLNIAFYKRYGDKYYPEYVKCFNLYASTLPEPAISVKDVENFLNLVFTDDRVFTITALTNFMEVFPENPRFPSPRSLKYICRCKVRECIQKRPTFTAALSEIHIPVGLKDYLLFMSD